MKTIVIFCLVTAACAAPPAASGREAQVLKSTFEIFPEGNYFYEFAQDDGIGAQAKGEFHPGNGKDDAGAVVATGQFEWVGPDGVAYTGTYTADENGYHPHYTQGQGGSIPEEVVKALNKK